MTRNTDMKSRCADCGKFISMSEDKEVCLDCWEFQIYDKEIKGQK